MEDPGFMQDIDQEPRQPNERMEAFLRHPERSLIRLSIPLKTIHGKQGTVKLYGIGSPSGAGLNPALKYVSTGYRLSLWRPAYIDITSRPEICPPGFMLLSGFFDPNDSTDKRVETFLNLQNTG